MMDEMDEKDEHLHGNIKYVPPWIEFSAHRCFMPSPASGSWAASHPQIRIFLATFKRPGLLTGCSVEDQTAAAPAISPSCRC